MEITSKVQELLHKAIVAEFGQRAVKLEQINIEHPADQEHGDYSSNISLKLKIDNLAPFDLANRIVNGVRKLGLPQWLGKIDVVAPGFINIWLSEEYLSSQVKEALEQKDKFGESNVGKGKTVVIDYSSPNIAKPFGIGHLRSTIIGQALYNLYKTIGWETIGDNHLGDWGTQFGKMMVALKLWNKKPIKSLTIKDLEKLYVRFHKEAEMDPDLEEQGRIWFKKLEDKDKEAVQIWKDCVEVSLKEFNRVYDLLGVKIDYSYGESFYEDKLTEVVSEAKKKGISKLSEGATIIDFAPLNIPPALILKSDGATTYTTRDLACIKYRENRWHPDLYIYEVGSEQKLYFQQTFLAAEKLGYAKAEQFVHTSHGLIRWPHGKMSTRQGDTIHLEEILNEAIKRAEKIIKKSETSRGLPLKEQKEVASKIGIGAIKYYDLSHQLQTDIIFDWDKMFVLEGNSGPYLQYVYARCQSVLAKSKQSNFQAPSTNFQYNNEELLLMRRLYQYPEVILKAAQSYSPNLICNYLFDLAQKYNNLYNQHSILQSDKGVREMRLGLTAATAQIIKNGLSLLGIETPKRM
jgi:arginyl-tRNA synthetase